MPETSPQKPPAGPGAWKIWTRRMRAAVLGPIHAQASSWASRSRLASRLYYALFSGAFGREQQAVLWGKRRYYESLQAPEASSYLLRRNTHRLEKGLLMRPRREVFALDYIEETVGAYEGSRARMAGQEAPPPPEVPWAHDVLTRYFEATAAHPILDACEERFRACGPVSEKVAAYAAQGNGQPTERVPYKRLLDEPPVSYEAFAKLSHQRRSVRWFEQKPVPRELLDKAVLAAAQAPSACNRQPFQFRFFDDPERVQRLAELPMGTRGYAHNIPVLAAVVGRQRAYFDERDRHVIYVDGSLAAMAFMYALETLGLSSCPINWPDIEPRERAMAHELGLEPDERPILLLAIGYPDPDGLVAFSQKKDLDEIRRYG